MEKDIRSLEEVLEADVKYFLIDAEGNRTGKWIEIRLETSVEGKCYEIHRHTRQFQLYNFETKGNYIRTWKTLNGAIRFVKRNFPARFR